jgi:hypothetical protein
LGIGLRFEQDLLLFNINIDGGGGTVGRNFDGSIESVRE